MSLWARLRTSCWPPASLPGNCSSQRFGAIIASLSLVSSHPTRMAGTT